MEKHLKTLNIAILALFAANTLFFSIKNTIFEVVFFKLPISATDIFIIIDYIDMASSEDRKEIEKLLKNCLKDDRAKTQVEGFTKLNLMELTRKSICGFKEQ